MNKTKHPKQQQISRRTDGHEAASAAKRDVKVKREKGNATIENTKKIAVRNEREIGRHRKQFGGVRLSGRGATNKRKRAREEKGGGGERRRGKEKRIKEKKRNVLTQKRTKVDIKLTVQTRVK